MLINNFVIHCNAISFGYFCGITMHYILYNRYWHGISGIGFKNLGILGTFSEKSSL